MGHVAKVKAATVHARAVAKVHRHYGTGAAIDAADVARMVPPETANGLGRYRTVKRVVTRAIGYERERTGPIFVGRRDARHTKAITQDEAGFDRVLADLKSRGYSLRAE